MKGIKIMKKSNRIFICLAAALCLMLVVSYPVCASAATTTTAEVAKNVWATIESQAKEIVNKVVFPVLDFILVVWLTVNAALAYKGYKEHGHVDWASIIFPFVCLIFSLTMPLYIWQLIG